MSQTFRRGVCLAICVASLQNIAVGQPAAPFSEAQAVQAQRAVIRRGPAGRPQPAANQPAKPNAKDQKAADGKDKAGKQDDKKKEDKPAVVKRPDKPPRSPRAEELKVRPDADGMLRVHFRYQPWPDVLDWLAEVSSMSLDWQELPTGYLNLTMQRAYTVVQTRDLINRHLLLRGFTMLENDELLSVSKISSLDVGMVPRVSTKQLEALAKQRPHAYVKVSFELDWMLAAEAVEELKPMLSPNHKLNALSKTNRIEAVDAATNLRDVLQVLNQEQSDAGQKELVRQFVLEHVRAAEVKTQLEELLGMESKPAGGGSSGNSRQMQQLQQLQQQMQQMQRQQKQKSGGSPKAEPKVRLIVNHRKNSILANAPPDKMAIISQAVEALDVRTSRADSLLDRRYQLEVYRLRSLDPAALAKTLEDLGDLDPVTQLEVDTANQALLVYGTIVDHTMIRQLLKRLDGTTRKFEVVRLRNLPADYVAGTIEFMMVGDDKDQGPGYDSYYYYRYGPGSREQQQEDEFRVDADIENNLLLLWASEPEIESVMELLVKIGERPPAGGNPDKLRVLDAIPPEQAAEFIEQLRRAWPMLGPNKLNLPEVKQEQQPTEPTSPATTEASLEAGLGRPSAATTWFVQHQTEAAERSTVASDTGAPNAEEEEVPATELLKRLLEKQQNAGRPATPPPIDLSIGPDGRVIIRSDDPRALDLLEELIGRVSPPKDDFKIFYLTHADAYWVKANLVEFFEEKEEDDSRSGYPFYYYSYRQSEKKEPRSRLSQRRELKFIYDLDTNSILVQGGDPQQLRTVAQLIEIYDKPVPTDSKSARVTSVYPVRYSKAQIIADTIKEVYRDLLSSTDKALAGNPEKKERPNLGTTVIYGGGNDDEPERTQVRFKGKLSLGVDAVTNTLLISCEGENLLQNVTEMVKTLDKAAQPLSSVSTVTLHGGLNSSKVSDVLTRLLVEKAAASEAAKQPAAGGPKKGNQQAEKAASQ